MPKNNKKGKRCGATAQSDDDFDDMLAEMRSADLCDPDANSSDTTASSMTSSIVVSSASSASSAAKPIKVPEKRILEAVNRRDIGQLRRWSRQGLRITSILPLTHAVVLGELGIVQCLVEELGADVNQADREGRTPLYCAALLGDLAMMRCLVKDLGADVEQADQEGCTPLRTATCAGNLAVVRCLIKDLHVDVNTVDNMGRTPLQAAVHLDDPAMVRALVNELRADVNKAGHEGFPPLWIAAAGGNLSLVQCLVKELGADIDRVDQDGVTPLMATSAKKHTDIVKWLFKAGANTQAFIANDKDSTAAKFSKLSGASTEQTAYLEAKTHCARSGCSGAGLRKCMGCRQARYCGEACQLAHWKAHKTDCRRWSAELAVGTRCPSL
jgi:ankyrin repeat protein